MVRLLASEGIEDIIGSKGIIKKVEFVRIITKALYSLGYERSGAALEDESGMYLHSSAVSLFRQQVLDGYWDESLVTLRNIDHLDENILKSASFLILEQKFFELLEKNRIMDAVKILRSEITPLDIKRKRIHELSGCIVSSSKLALLGFANVGMETANSRMKLLEELQKIFPPTVMIPERRLERLVEQALSVQRDACYFHNSLDSTLSLYTDHRCGKEQIPSQTTQIIPFTSLGDMKMTEVGLKTLIMWKVLQGHHDEVWFLQFSNNGKYLASSSSDRSIIIWEVHEDGRVSWKHRLTGHEKPVIMVAWSRDDHQLLSCGMEEVVRRWDVSSGTCLHVYQKDGLDLISCAWFPDGKQLLCGVTDQNICLWDLDGKELESWKGLRATRTADIAVTEDGKWIISMCKETAITLLNREAKREKIIVEEQTITTFSISKDDNFLLVNLINQEIHLWSIIDEPKLITKYKGHKCSRLVIRSCFGGLKQAFIASGSEDSQVYVWHRGAGDLIQALPGHAGAVNCVSWHPTNHHMFASASDDHTVRVWGLNRINLKRKEAGNSKNGPPLQWKQ